MPAIVSHWLLGKRTLPDVKALCTDIELNETCYLWGCQGPDIFFFHRLLPQMRGENLQYIGHDMHEIDPAGFFRGMAPLISRARDRELRRGLISYLLGIGCHYSYDRNAHPYINWLENKMIAADPRGSKFHYHGDIESMLDIIMLRNDAEMLPCDVSLLDCLPDADGIKQTAGVFWTRALAMMYGKEMTSRQADELTGDMRASFRFLEDRTLLKKPFILKLEHLAGKKNAPVSAFMRSLTEGTDYDYANVCHSEWNNPAIPRMKSCESFFELTDKAQADTLRAVSVLLDAVAGREDSAEGISAFTGGIDFSGAPAVLCQ